MQKATTVRPRWISEGGVIAAVFISVIAGTGVLICVFAAILKVAHLI